MYCEKCKHLVDENLCPYCESSELREPKVDDFCFLTQTDALFVNVLMDVLDQNHIPAQRKNATEMALNVLMGQNYVRYNVYVPYAFFEDAVNVAQAFMHADEDNVTFIAEDDNM